MLLYRILFIVFLALVTVSCGFTPMYGSSGIYNNSLLGQRPEIYIGNIPDRSGQILRNLLIDELYTEGKPESYFYELQFTPLKEKTTEMGIKKDASSTRIQLELSTNMTLVHKINGNEEIVLERKIRSVGAHNVLDNQLASLISRKDLVHDILKEMTQNIKTEIDLYFYSFVE